MIKKKHCAWLLLPLMASWLTLSTSCSKATYLKVDKDSIQATITGTQGDIAIETDGKSVEVAHAPRWIKTSLNEENTTLHYEVTLNSDRKLREDSIVLKTSDLTQAIFVKQTFKATFIKLTPDTVKFAQKGGTADVTVEVDAESELTVDNQAIAKITEPRKVTITMPQSYSPKTVEKHIAIGCDDITADLTVIQETPKCKTCGGKGHLNKPCPICDGLGARVCCMYTGKAVCQTCGGSGIAE